MGLTTVSSVQLSILLALPSGPELIRESAGQAEGCMSGSAASCQLTIATLSTPTAKLAMQLPSQLTAYPLKPHCYLSQPHLAIAKATF